jgi:RNA polymerase sigma-70 factor (ECF subfamily)
LRAGDDDAFSALVTRHRPWLVGLGTRLLGNDRYAAEDLAQETLLKLHAAVRQDHRPIRVRPWLAVVARNASRDEHRRRRPELPGDLPEGPTTGESVLMLDPALSRAWSTLGGRHREVIYLRELVGLSYREIATVMDLSGSAVETLLFRARAALRREYERAGGTRFGCGVLGLGLFRFAGGDRRHSAALAHVPGCDTCGRAVESLRGLAPATAPTGPPPGSRATPPRPRRVLPDLPSAADVVQGPPSLWTSLSGGEPLLAKVLAVAAAVAAASLPAAVVLSRPPADRPARPAVQALAAAPSGLPPAPASTTSAAVEARPASAPMPLAMMRYPTTNGSSEVVDPMTASEATSTPAQRRDPASAAGGSPGPALNAGALGAAPNPRPALAQDPMTRPRLRDRLTSASGRLPVAGPLEPLPVSQLPGPSRLVQLVDRWVPDASLPEPVLATSGDAAPEGVQLEPAGPVGGGDADAPPAPAPDVLDQPVPDPASGGALLEGRTSHARSPVTGAGTSSSRDTRWNRLGIL